MLVHNDFTLGTSRSFSLLRNYCKIVSFWIFLGSDFLEEHFYQQNPHVADMDITCNSMRIITNACTS